MLLVFEGKGCKNCPFCYGHTTLLGSTLEGSVTGCLLSEQELVGNIKLPKFKPKLKEKPKDCPFAQYPNTLEIEAHNE